MPRFRPASRRNAVTVVAPLLLAPLLAAPASAAEREWLKIQTSRFGVISELDEQATRRWAVEFDQFVDALHQLYGVADGVALPPLTIVLFEQSRAFAAYRMQTESGQANVAGFFGNMGTWSVIGVPGRVRGGGTRQVIYHEAVHWFASADEVARPTWFDEGIAEVYSTFEVVDGKGRWGAPIQNNVDYLTSVGLLPLDEFLRMSQDEALHGSPKYYPVAWAFMHYLMFGNNGVERSKLAEFLRQQRSTDLDTAFTSSFGKSYDEMTRELRGYLQRGRYGLAELPVRDRGGEMQVEPASDAQVEFALARVALAGGNDELARKHIDAVLAAAPRSPEVHEMLALLAARTDDVPAHIAALDRAIELGSRDSSVYEMKAFRLVEEHRDESASAGNDLPADKAREAADLFGRSITLRPRNRNPYNGLVFALLNVDAITDGDSTALAAGRRAYPTDGVVLLGEAVVERHRGNVDEAVQLLRRARAEPFTLAREQRSLATGLHDNWLLESVSDRLDTLVPAERYDEAHALLDAQLADESLKGRPRAAISSMKAELTGYQRIQAAVAAGNDGKPDEAKALLTKIASDPDASERTRREAQRLLERVPKN
jgi:hypothetical protein